MTIDTHPHHASSQTEISQDLQSQSDLRGEDLFHHNHQTQSTLFNILLDDQTIVRRFACGKKRLVINHNLRIDYAHNLLQLSTPTGELIAMHKLADRLHYILVKKDTVYSELIQNTIAEFQFIPIDTDTAKQGFIRYQKYEIPAGYTLKYAPAVELWKTWAEEQQKVTSDLRLDILILARSKWYRVQDTICVDDRLDIQTRLGLISISLKDRIAWIAKLGDIPTIANADLHTQSGVNSGGDSEILGKIISKLAIDAPASSELNIDPYTTITRSVPSNSPDSFLAFEDDRSSTLAANIVTTTKEYLKTAAIDVLENYIKHGETIIRTEVITDPQGTVISEKTVTIHRGCPKWALEAVLYTQ